MSRLADVKMGMGTPGQKNRTREDLRRDILIGLGAPIIKVELTNDHLDDCINTALKQFWMHHRDGSFENYYTYVVTKDDAARGWFRVPETIDTVSSVIYLGNVGYPQDRIYEGDMSSEVIAEGEYVAENPTPPDPNEDDDSGTGTPGFANAPYHDRMIAGYQMNGAGTPYSYSISGSSSGNGSYVGGSAHFNPGAMSQMSYADFYERQQNFANMEAITGTTAREGKCFKYARYQRRLYMYFPFQENDGVCIRCFENVDPDLNPEFGEVFDDETVKELAQSLAKQIWGSILRKYGGIVLIGGVTLDGQQLYDEGSQEYNDTLSALKNEQPVSFIIG
jgi:hypothetical protein